MINSGIGDLDGRTPDLIQNAAPVPAQIAIRAILAFSIEASLVLSLDSRPDTRALSVLLVRYCRDLHVPAAISRQQQNWQDGRSMCSDVQHWIPYSCLRALRAVRIDPVGRRLLRQRPISNGWLRRRCVGLAAGKDTEKMFQTNQRARYHRKIVILPTVSERAICVALEFL
jgi:hypothetical protein